MKQDPNQKFLLWGIFLIVGVFVLTWILGCAREGYSPYRRTGGCSPRTGWTYLDAYEQQDYYRKYPYVYPTPVSYTTAWYAGRRAMDENRMMRKDQTLLKYQ